MGLLVAFDLLFAVGLTLQLLDPTAPPRSPGLLLLVAALFSGSGVVVGMLGHRWLAHRSVGPHRFARLVRDVTLASGLGSAAWILVGALAYRVVAHDGPLTEEDSWQEIFATWLLQTLLLAAAHSSVVAARFARRAKAHEHAERRAALLLKEARGEALRRRLDPHFLLNALNAITDLVEQRSDAAGPALAALTELLHHAVREHRNLAPLQDELVALARYLHVQSLRYGDDLECHVDVDPTLALTPFPPLVLLTLVENAIKHGFRQGETPLQIRVSARRTPDASTAVVVQNRSRLEEARHDGTGIENLRERIRVLFDGAGSFSIAENGEGWVIAEILLSGCARPQPESLEPECGSPVVAA